MHPAISLPPRSRRTGALDEPLPRLLDAIGAWRARARGRAELARLDARLLRDIGITPCDAAGEAGKPFWRA